LRADSIGWVFFLGCGVTWRRQRDGRIVCEPITPVKIVRDDCRVNVTIEAEGFAAFAFHGGVDWSDPHLEYPGIAGAGAEAVVSICMGERADGRAGQMSRKTRDLRFQVVDFRFEKGWRGERLRPLPSVAARCVPLRENPIAAAVAVLLFCVLPGEHHDRTQRAAASVIRTRS
jgi:hypothetical protein